MTFAVDQACAPAHSEIGAGPAALRRIKVLFLVDTFLGMGGAEGAVLRMVRHLPSLGVDCSIASFNLSQDAKFLSLFSCPLYDLRLDRLYDWNALRVAFRLGALLREQKFDIVHTMFPAADLWGASIAKLCSSALVVSSRRDMGIVREKKHELPYRLLAKSFDQVQAVSNAVREISIRQDRLRPERVHTVHNGVEMERIDAALPLPNFHQTFDLIPQAPTVLTALGKIWPVKGVDILIRAAGRVCQKFPDTNFVVAGWAEGDYPQQLLLLAESLGIRRNLRFIGRRQEILSIMKASDVFTLMSRSEGLSNALLEAMSCGLPCIATAVGGNPEVVVHEKTGYLVQNEDFEAAARHVAALLGDANLRRTLGANARARVEQEFTVDSMVRRVAELYRHAMGERLNGVS